MAHSSIQYCTRDDSENKNKNKSMSIGAYELVLSLPCGMQEHEISVSCSKEHDRQPSNAENEELIHTIWEKRSIANPCLFNGTKFRFVAVSTNNLSLGITDYKTFLGTNCAPHWNQLSHLHLASPLGNAAIVETSDEKVVLLRRSGNVGEMPNTLVMPGGHPEPETVNMKTMDDWKDFCINEEESSGWNSRVRHELWDAMLREVVEETGIPKDELGTPLCIGFSRRLQNYRPNIIFFIKCTLSSAIVQEMYAAGPEHKSESVELITLDRVEFVKQVITNDSMHMPGCHRGGVELYRRYLIHHGLL